jgi:hypothetical protein
MRTACFFEYTGPGRVSIARYAPRKTPAGFRVYKPLAPGPWFNSVSKEEYERLFGAQLAALDPQKTWDELVALAGGEEPVLLCWEAKNDCDTGKTYCHRHMVAEWFQRELGRDVQEVDR